MDNKEKEYGKSHDCWHPEGIWHSKRIVQKKFEKKKVVTSKKRHQPMIGSKVLKIDGTLSENSQIILSWKFNTLMICGLQKPFCNNTMTACFMVERVVHFLFIPEISAWAQRKTRISNADFQDRITSLASLTQHKLLIPSKFFHLVLINMILFLYSLVSYICVCIL